MKADEIRLSDWTRIVFGETPPVFFIEVVLRTGFIFLLLIICMRMLGKRMAAQISRIELVALFSLAAAIGVPLQAPDRGVLPAVVIAVVVVVVGKIVSAMVFRNQKFEARVTDRLTILVNDGVFDMKKIRGTSLSTTFLFGQLRSMGLRHLGQVKRLYFQSNGSFALVKEETPVPGLCLIPAIDSDFRNEQTEVSELVCQTCGQSKKKNGAGTDCTNCHDNTWVHAIL